MSYNDNQGRGGRGGEFSSGPRGGGRGRGDFRGRGRGGYNPNYNDNWNNGGDDRGGQRGGYNQEQGGFRGNRGYRGDNRGGRGGYGGYNQERGGYRGNNRGDYRGGGFGGGRDFGSTSGVDRYQAPTSAPIRQEWNSEISAESSSSVETGGVQSTSTLSAASSTLSLTPAPTPSSSSDPSFSEIHTLTEAAKQLSLQETEALNISGKLLVDPPLERANRADKEKEILTTNFFPIEVQPKLVYHYDVNLSILTTDERKISLAKGNKIQKSEICMAAIKIALETYGILREGEATLYGGGAMLYSSESLLAALKPHSSVLTVSIADLPEEIRRKISVTNATDIVMEFGMENQLNMGDFADQHRNRDLGKLNRDHQSFFDVLTNEPALRRGDYVSFGCGRLFPRDGQAYNRRNGQEMKDGINKGIVFIEPTVDRMVPALVLDSKVGQFYVNQNIIRTICELLNWNPNNLRAFPMGSQIWHEVNQFIRGMRFTLLAGHHERSFTAAGISEIPIGQLQEDDFRNGRVPVLRAQRFGNLDVRNVKLDWPAIVVRGMHGKRIVTSHYPMELLMVSANQRVPLHKIGGNPPKAAHVRDRFTAIHKMVEYLDLSSSSPYRDILQAFGVKLSSKPLKVEAIRRKMPEINPSSSRPYQPSADTAAFKIFGYKEPGKADDVVVAYDCPLNIIQNMQKALEKTAKEKGIQIARWHSLEVSPLGNDARSKLEATFEQVAKWKREKEVGRMVLLIYVDSDRNSHGYLKLFERRYLTLSQHLSLKVAGELAHQYQTRENVLHKMNCKLGGINHGVIPDDYAKNDWISNGKSLIVGYDVSHPTGEMREDRIDKKPPTQASIVGMSFNGAKNAETFIGDYHFQLPRKEEVGDHILIDRIKWMLGLFYKNRKRLPENIFFLRDGVSEGQYNMVLNKEFPAFLEGIDEFKNMKEEEIPNIREWQPNYVVVVVCKRHNKRFAVESGGSFQNARPGTVADDKVVRKDITQFYMIPHKVIKGTGKFPSYHVLKYDLDKDVENKTQDKLQAFLFALSFTHQIFGGSISLPEPIYQADEWAKRGKDVYKTYEEMYEFPRAKKWNQNMYSTAPIDYEQLTKHLCYKDTSLQECRVNA